MVHTYERHAYTSLCNQETHAIHHTHTHRALCCDWKHCTAIGALSLSLFLLPSLSLHVSPFFSLSPCLQVYTHSTCAEAHSTNIKLDNCKQAYTRVHALPHTCNFLANHKIVIFFYFLFVHE